MSQSQIKPTLVVMAAGMGSRYGGLKQIDPVDPQGHIIMDFSVYDALKAGFGKVVFIIKKENEAAFREAIGDRISRQIPTEIVFQELDSLPAGYAVPEGRVKPWGTGHAVLSCREVVDTPFAVINADDFYGRTAFRLAGDSLRAYAGQGGAGRYMMVAYRLENTLTENGHVARGVCRTDEDGYLAGITERTKIFRRDGRIVYTEDEGQTFTALAPDTPVSMNMWGFTRDFMDELAARFPRFLEENLKKNPIKCEYFLPFVVDEMLKEGKAAVKVEQSPDRWFGVTYKEDKPVVEESIRRLKEEGLYPASLWD